MYDSIRFMYDDVTPLGTTVFRYDDVVNMFYDDDTGNKEKIRKSIAFLFHRDRWGMLNCQCVHFTNDDSPEWLYLETNDELAKDKLVTVKEMYNSGVCREYVMDAASLRRKLYNELPRRDVA